MENIPESQYISLTNKEEYANLFLRTAAFFFDYLLISIITFVILLIFGYIYVLIFKSLPANLSLLFRYLSYLLYILYSTFFLTIWSTTPGKKSYGIILKNEYNTKLTFKQALIRSLLQPLSLLFLGIGYMSVLQGEYKQAWHDKRAHTFVLATKLHNYFLPALISIIGLIFFL